MRILAVCAHPDDEVYTCGGTLAKMAAKKNQVFVLILTEGCSSQYKNASKMIQQKRNESEKVRKILGIKEVFWANHPDMKLDTLTHVELNSTIETVIKEIKPELVFTHHPDDLNLDHRLASHSTLIASRPGITSVKTVAYYEGAPGSKDFNANWFVDISGKLLEKKLQAVKTYKSEIRPFPHFRNVKAIKAFAEVRGIEAGLKAAEAFEIARQIS